MNAKDFTGTWTLAMLALKRDRLRLVAWVVGISLITAMMVASFGGILATEQDVINMINAHATNPVTRLFLGPASGTSLGGFMMFRVSTVIAVTIAFFGILTVVRHTRENEENGCEELTGSTVVGRQASLMAALLVTTAANVVLGVLLAVAFIANGQEVLGSFVAGAALAAVGVAFAGVAAITAQLTDTSRGANGMAGMIMAVAFLASGLGNALGEFRPASLEVISAWPVWLSPFGWYQQMLAFHQNNWWPLLLFAAFLPLAAIAAFVLNSRRDVGAGIMPARKGPAVAPASLLSPLGLAWRLQRKLFFAWAVAVLLFGAVLGASVSELSEQMADLERAGQVFGDIFSMHETFAMALAAILGGFVIFYTIPAFMRMVTEEAKGLAEPVLATAVSPGKWMLSHAVCFMLGSFMLLLLLGVGSSAATLFEADIRWYKVVESALVQMPAVLVLAGFASMTFGLAPRWSGTLSWAGLIVCLVTGPFLGPALDLPQWVQNISPFTHIPAPTETVSAAPLIVLLLVAAAFTAVGFYSFCQRRLRTS